MKPGPRSLLPHLFTLTVLQGCNPSYSVVYPICACREVSEEERERFDEKVTEAVSFYFEKKSEETLLLGETTVTVVGEIEEHRNFIPWIANHGVLPQYVDSPTRGQFVVASEYIEKSAWNALEYAIQSQSRATRMGGGICCERLHTNHLREMDSVRLVCNCLAVKNSGANKKRIDETMENRMLIESESKTNSSSEDGDRDLGDSES